MATPRIMSELRELLELATENNRYGVKFIVDKSPVDDPTFNAIVGRIFPKSDIFNQAAFQIEIKLPSEYPFKAPEVRVITRIYHPNVDQNGRICIALLNSSESFKPTTRLVEIVVAVIHLIDNPDLDHALVPEIADEYLRNRPEFNRKALEMVKAHGLPRQ